MRLIDEHGMPCYPFFGVIDEKIAFIKEFAELLSLEVSISKDNELDCVNAIKDGKTVFGCMGKSLALAIGQFYTQLSAVYYYEKEVKGVEYGA